MSTPGRVAALVAAAAAAGLGLWAARRNRPRRPAGPPRRTVAASRSLALLAEANGVSASDAVGALVDHARAAGPAARDAIYETVRCERCMTKDGAKRSRQDYELELTPAQWLHLDAAVEEHSLSGTGKAVRVLLAYFEEDPARVPALRAAQ